MMGGLSSAHLYCGVCFTAILLCDALCGCEFVLKHIDDSDLLVKSDSIITNDTLHTICDKGMPIKGNPFNCGNLYIKFDIIYPNYNLLTPKVREALKSVLPYNKNKINNKENMEQAILIEQDMNHIPSHSDIDDEDDMNGQRVNCQQQ